MRRYRGLAEQIELKLQNKRSLIQESSSLRSKVEAMAITPSVTFECNVAKEPSHTVEINRTSKHVDTQEILEEFDPFAPSTCSVENSVKCRQSSSTDEFSKTGSSDDSVALTNSTDLYHYMDMTGSSLGDGRSTRRSLTPVPDGDWNASNKPPGYHEIRATYEGLNEYLDSILISSASSHPSRAKCSDDEVTPTNGALCESLRFISLDDDKRPKSCPLSPIPHEPMRVPPCESGSEKLVEIAESCDKPETEKPRLVRSNSYTLDAPSPMLLAHLEAEKKKKDVKKTTRGVAVPSKNRVSVIVKRSAGTKRNESQLSGSRITHSPPKKAKNPTTAAVPLNSPAKVRKELIVQPEVQKLFADLQAEHNRQMEELLRRQRMEQEMIRQAILGQKLPTGGPHTWAEYLQTNGAGVDAKQDDRGPNAVSAPHPRKSLSTSFILAEVSSGADDRSMSLSAPPGSLVASLASPKRPSSSPALTNSVTTIPVSPPARDTNGNLTIDNITIPQQETAFISQLLASSKPESASSDNERVSVNEASPRAKRRVWTHHQAEAHDPDWLQISRQRQMVRIQIQASFLHIGVFVAVRELLDR